MRPIDADAYVTVMLYDDEKEEFYDERMTISESLDRYTNEGCPHTIDAVSVVHGEWKHNPKIGWGETWVCSICGEKTTSSVMGYPRYRYCPMCGARMKGADDETD